MTTGRSGNVLRDCSMTSASKSTADHVVPAAGERGTHPAHPGAGVEDPRRTRCEHVRQAGLPLDVGPVGDQLGEVGTVAAVALRQLLRPCLLPPGLRHAVTLGPGRGPGEERGGGQPDQPVRAPPRGSSRGRCAGGPGAAGSSGSSTCRPPRRPRPLAEPPMAARWVTNIRAPPRRSTSIRARRAAASASASTARLSTTSRGRAGRPLPAPARPRARRADRGR